MEDHRRSLNLSDTPWRALLTRLFGFEVKVKFLSCVQLLKLSSILGGHSGGMEGQGQDCPAEPLRHARNPWSLVQILRGGEGTAPS